MPVGSLVNVRRSGDSHSSLILKAIEAKNKKGGPAYASGKTLIVFLDAGAGVWSPNSVTRRLPDPLHFAVVWVVGLHRIESEEYIYGVTQLALSDGNAPTFLIRITSDFSSWTTERIQ
jgi:hypothetical protein